MYRIAALSTVAIALLGCRTGSSTTKAGHDFTATRKIAIVQVTGSEGDVAVQNEVGDYLMKEFLKRGFTVIERTQVQALLKEQEFQTSGFTEGNAVKAGRIGGLTPRFHGAPTNRSHRTTTETDAPELLRRCREDEVDAAVLVPS